VGIQLGLGDPYPDVLLFDDASRSVWIVEAVTSDGEVDHHKLNAIKEFCRKQKNVKFSGATTAYKLWKDAAKRQAAHKNIATGTYIWIQEAGGTILRLLEPPASSGDPEAS